MACKNKDWYRSAAKWIGKIKNWYQVAAKWIGKIKNWYQVAAKCIHKNKDQFQVADSSICKIIQGLIQEQVYTQIFLNCHLAAFLHETWNLKWQFKKICVYTCSCISPCMILQIELSATWNWSLFLWMHLAATWYQFLMAADRYQPLFLQAILSARQYSWFYFAWPRLFLTALGCFCLAYNLHRTMI